MAENEEKVGKLLKEYPRLRELVLDQLGVDLIENQSLREWIIGTLVNQVKDEFFYQPASMTGRYHPFSELDSGGLVRHTQNCIVMAQTLKPLYSFNSEEWDHIIGALILHDIAKPSKLHPIEAHKFFAPGNPRILKHIRAIEELIGSHMGKWDQEGQLPRPKSTSQQFVHLCDYLASRRHIIIDTREEL